MMKLPLVVERFLGADFVDKPDEYAFEDFRVFVKGNYGHANEPDRVLLAEQIMANANDYSAHNSRMSLEDHQAVVDRLHAKSKLQPGNTLGQIDIPDYPRQT